MEIFNYLLRVCVCMGLGYLPYKMFFKKLTFFSLNRFYLLFIVTASLILPALHIKVIEYLPETHFDQNFKLSSNGNFELERIVPAAEQTNHFNWQFIICIGYIITCLAVFAKLLFNIFKVVKQAALNGVRIGNHYIVEVEHTNNSSFFNIIFLHAKIEKGLELDQVLTHEKVHASLLHSVDLLFIELVKVFFWFNPLIYFIGNDIKEMHEYEVDDHLKHMFDPKGYASLLIKLLNQPSPSIINQFSAYALKSRIKMLFRSQTRAYKKWCYVLIFPLLFAMGYFFSIERVYGRVPNKNNFVLVLDAGHGGSNSGAVSADGRYEKDINLQMVKIIQSTAVERGIKVILTRSDDRFLDVEHRIANEGDAFISIHMNSALQGSSKISGTEIKIDQNSLFPASKRLAFNVSNELQNVNEINTDHKVSVTSRPHSIYILSHNKVPGILVEVGYMTNGKDLNFILSQQGQHVIADKIIDAVINYSYMK